LDRWPAAQLALPPEAAGAARGRFQRWWQARLPLSDTLVLTQRNVYILPTGPGLDAGATLLVLLVASINFQLNLGYLLTFLLAGSAVVGMHLSHATLRGLTLHLKAPEPTFGRQRGAGDAAHQRAEHAAARHRCHVRPWHGRPLGLGRRARAGQRQSCRWRFQPSAGPAPRAHPDGRNPLSAGHLPRLDLLAPGRRRCWCTPRPKSRPPPLAAGRAALQRRAAPAPQGIGEFDGVRAYRRGDPLKLVVWKKAAKSGHGHGRLVSRDAQQAQRHELWLDLAHAALPDHEARISRLTPGCCRPTAWAWTMACACRRLHTGAAHRQRCLEATAAPAQK
jgi:uncharacterized protein (DUF58 family)